MSYFLQTLAAIILDALFGDPRWYPHPVKWIGRLIIWSETLSRKLLSNLYFAGFVTVCLVLLGTGTAVTLILLGANALSSTAGIVVAVTLLYTTIAGRDLLRHSAEVYKRLEKDNSLEEGRLAVGMIVGRDTSKLDREGVCRATIETVAENMVDGITAPLFFAVLGSCFSIIVPLSAIGCSAIGAFLYKAINTMDSMIGYKNDKYLEFGRFAAKLDDVVNFLPARLSGCCLIVAAFVLKLDYKKAAVVFQADRLQHSSPNAGHPEAATAGALGVRLGGPSVYFDKVVEKPFLGAGSPDPCPEDIGRTNSLAIVASLLFFLLLVGLRLAFIPID